MAGTRWLAAGAALAWIAAGGGPAAAGEVVYRNDFQGSVGPEWSNFATDTSPAGGRRFLGRFHNNAVTLSLRDLPRHNQVKVSFDLYVLEGWDGNDVTSGPDTWRLGLEGDAALLNTTFSNVEDRPQAYPEPFPGGSNAERSGAAESNSLGYAGGDTVYRLSFTFRHARQNLALVFAGSGLDPASESWGLDNISVEVESVRPGNLAVSPRRLSFGTTPVGRPRVKQIRLRNRSRGPLSGNVGFLLPPFRVTAGTGSFTLPPRGRMTITVEFDPAAAGAAADTLVITSDDPRRGTARVPVSGRGREPREP